MLKTCFGAPLRAETSATVCLQLPRLRRPDEHYHNIPNKYLTFIISTWKTKRSNRRLRACIHIYCPRLKTHYTLCRGRVYDEKRERERAEQMISTCGMNGRRGFTSGHECLLVGCKLASLHGVRIYENTLQPPDRSRVENRRVYFTCRHR